MYIWGTSPQRCYNLVIHCSSIPIMSNIYFFESEAYYQIKEMQYSTALSPGDVTHLDRDAKEQTVTGADEET
jgi:hypothetical protein